MPGSMAKYETSDYTVAATAKPALSYSDDCSDRSASMVNVVLADFITRGCTDVVVDAPKCNIEETISAICKHDHLEEQLLRIMAEEINFSNGILL